MRIGIDAHALGTRAGGNETYVRQLLRAIHTVAPETDLFALVNPNAAKEPLVCREFPIIPLAVRSSWVRVPILLPMAAIRQRLDILHVQYTAPPYCPCPYVVALHDVVWKRFPETLTPVERYRLQLLTPGTLRRARRVFCLTNAIKQEVAEIYRVSPEKIDVVSPAVDPMYRPISDESALTAVRERYRLPHDYILCISTLQPRKNVVRLAQAVARLGKHGLPHRLVLTGRRTFYGPIAEELEKRGLADQIIFTGYLDDAELPALICGAAAFAYVSLYEGFGFPVVEALASGVPVLISTAAALVEVAGDAALKCDPYDVEAMESGLVRLLTDTALRRHCAEAGPQRARRFTFEDMGRAALEGYRKALA